MVLTVRPECCHGIGGDERPHHQNMPQLVHSCRFRLVLRVQFRFRLADLVVRGRFRASVQLNSRRAASTSPSGLAQLVHVYRVEEAWAPISFGEVFEPDLSPPELGRESLQKSLTMSDLVAAPLLLLRNRSAPSTRQFDESEHLTTMLKESD
jgi:hypothetical protein